MSKAIELAKECGLLSDTVHMYADEVETFFRRAQAMALRDAIYQWELPWGLANDLYIVRLRRMADELEAGE